MFSAPCEATGANRAAIWTPVPAGRAAGWMSRTMIGVNVGAGVVAWGCWVGGKSGEMVLLNTLALTAQLAGYGRQDAFCAPMVVTLAGTPAARSLACRPAGSMSSRMVTRTEPSGCLATVQAASCTLPGWAGGWVAGADVDTAKAAAAAPAASATPARAGFRRRARTARPRLVIWSAGVIARTPVKESRTTVMSS